MSIVTIHGDSSPRGILKHWMRKSKDECSREILRCWNALEAAEAREAELSKVIAQCAKAVGALAAPQCPLEFKKLVPAEIRAVVAELRARVSELEQQVPCTKCSGNKVVSTTTNTFACPCLDTYGCPVCKGTGYYEVTPIADCDQCKPLPAIPKVDV